MTEAETKTPKDVVVDFARPSFSTTSSKVVRDAPKDDVDVANVSVADTATSTSKDVVVDFAKPSFSTITSKVVRDAPKDDADVATVSVAVSGTSTHKEMNFENLQKSLKLSDQYVMNTIHKSKASSLQPVLHQDMVRKSLAIFPRTYPMAGSALKKIYEKILCHEIPFRIRYLKSQVTKAFTDFKMDMELFHHTHHDHKEDFKTKSINGKWEKELNKKINEGKLLMEALELKYGFNLGLLEDAVLPYSEHAWRDASDRCCFCPLNWLAKKKNNNYELECFDASNNLINKTDWFWSSVSKFSEKCCKCEKIHEMTREDFLLHLGGHAHKLGCHYHLATLKYVTHVCFLDAKKAHQKTLSQIDNLDYISQGDMYRSSMLRKAERKKEIQKIFILEQEQELVKEEESSDKESDLGDGCMTPLNDAEMIMEVEDNE